MKKRNKVQKAQSGLQNVVVPGKGSTADVISGGLSTASTGASIGSQIGGPWGAAIGAGAGAALGVGMSLLQKKQMDKAHKDAVATNKQRGVMRLLNGEEETAMQSMQMFSKGGTAKSKVIEIEGKKTPEIHTDKNFNVKNLGTTPHSKGGDKVLASEGDVVFPTQNDPKKFNKVMSAIEKGDKTTLQKEKNKLPKDTNMKNQAKDGVDLSKPKKGEDYNTYKNRIIKELKGHATTARTLGDNARANALRDNAQAIQMGKIAPEVAYQRSMNSNVASPMYKSEEARADSINTYNRDVLGKQHNYHKNMARLTDDPEKALKHRQAAAKAKEKRAVSTAQTVDVKSKDTLNKVNNFFPDPFAALKTGEQIPKLTSEEKQGAGRQAETNINNKIASSTKDAFGKPLQFLSPEQRSDARVSALLTVDNNLKKPSQLTPTRTPGVAPEKPASQPRQLPFGMKDEGWLPKILDGGAWIYNNFGPGSSTFDDAEGVLDPAKGVTATVGGTSQGRYNTGNKASAPSGPASKMSGMGDLLPSGMQATNTPGPLGNGGLPKQPVQSSSTSSSSKGKTGGGRGTTKPAAPVKDATTVALQKLWGATPDGKIGTETRKAATKYNLDRMGSNMNTPQSELDKLSTLPNVMNAAGEIVPSGVSAPTTGPDMAGWDARVSRAKDLGLTENEAIKGGVTKDSTGKSGFSVSDGISTGLALAGTVNNLIQSFKKPEKVKETYVNPELVKYKDRSQTARTASVHAQNGQMANARNLSGGSAGNVRANSAQAFADNAIRQGQISAQEASRADQISAQNVLSKNRANEVNAQRADMYQDINMKNQAATQSYREQALSDLGTFAQVKQQEKYMRSRDAKMDAMDEKRMDQMNQWTNFEIGDDGTVKFRGPLYSNALANQGTTTKVETKAGATKTTQTTTRGTTRRGGR